MVIDKKDLPKYSLILLLGYVALSALCAPLLWAVGIKGRFFPLAGWSLLFLMAVSVLVASTIWMVKTKLLISQEDNNALTNLQNRLKSLEIMEQDLSAFLDEFDDRSRKYFHATTQKSVHTYFKLRNIHAALTAFFKSARPVLDGRANRGSSIFNTIDESLSSNLEFSNSVISGDTSKEYISFPLLEQKVEELKLALNESVRDIEREFRSIPKAGN